jgi:hypothetical protein
MAKNMGRGTRLGAIRGRDQSTNTRTGLSTKRDTTSGRFVEVKRTGGDFRGVHKEK